MNIAFLLHPKVTVDFLYEDNTMRQGIEKLRVNGYSAIPVITRDGRYLTTISHGDFLWYMLSEADKRPDRSISIYDMERVLVKDVAHPDKNPPALITAEPEDLVFRAMEQNFIPVVDDWGSFIGIVTRRDILKYLATSSDREL